jgi:hypothetical protein
MRIQNSTGNLGIGTSSPDAIVSLNGQSAQAIDMVRETTASTAGNNLTVQAGGAASGGSNLGGGNLVLSSGISTGNNTSNVQVQTYPGGSSGTADNTALTALTVSATGATGSNAVTTVQGNGGSGTNKNGGTLTLAGGVSTGTGTSGIKFSVDGAGASGSSANSATTAMTIASTGNVGVGTTTPNTGSALDLSNNTNSLMLPVGTTGQEPGSPVNGMIRYNSTSATIEAYVNGAWVSLLTTGTGFSSCTQVSNSNSASCSAGYTMTGGGCAGIPNTGGNISSYPSSSNTWTCTGAATTAYAICCH